jgi:hypothetical protein
MAPLTRALVNNDFLKRFYHYDISLKTSAEIREQINQSEYIAVILKFQSKIYD